MHGGVEWDVHSVVVGRYVIIQKKLVNISVFLKKCGDIFSFVLMKELDV